MILVTLAEWQKLPPDNQGFVHYMQAELPGSELKGQACPYASGSKERQKYDAGQQRAVLAVQDMEE